MAKTPPPIQWPPSPFVGRPQWSCRGQMRGIGGTGTPRNHPSCLPRRPVGRWFSHVYGIRTSILRTSWLDIRSAVQSGAYVQGTGFCWPMIHPPLQCEVALPQGSGIRYTRTKTYLRKTFWKLTFFNANQLWPTIFHTGCLLWLPPH